ncbi:diguanylate cyclase [Halobacillus sp. Nhm2S1]|uniref:GGDEF domain-containing protein n=1 Tax=Halobacillus sp. Nhm2S1 TaxID=2866716 RepID=UPI001C7375E4|nr:diguanylate cyclase [Halobacillus sp. Nhm2S1]MBX0356870.1 diguanylate cyclase [Halobacillus sp. Nhm2S1]
MILKELISNVALLIASLFVYSQSTQAMPLSRSSTLKAKIVSGFLAGILANVLMQYSMHFDNTIVDLRHIPVILVAYYGGAVPALASMFLVIIGRFFIGFNTSSLLALFLIVSITLLTLAITRLNMSKRVKIFLTLTSSNVMFTILIVYLLQSVSTLTVLIPSFWIISYMAGFVSFYVIEFVRRSQNLLNKYKAEAATDGLTGLNNVRKFDQSFNKIAAQAVHKEEKLSLLYIDIDHFKKVNDTYGHKEGDQVLIELSRILSNTVRSFDIVSRNGGEEFTVILMDCPTDRARDISERIREKVENHSFLLTTGQMIHVTVSIGLACYNETTSEPKLLIKEADHALYDAKQTGRNKVCISPGYKWASHRA